MKFPILQQVVDFFSKIEDVVVERPPSGVYDEHGRWVALESETTTIRAAIQPNAESSLDREDSGRRVDGRLVLFTTAKLRTADVSARIQPDMILYNGQRWQVSEIDDWVDEAGYYRVVAVRMGQ